VLVKPNKLIAGLQPEHIDQDQFEIRTLKNSNYDKGLEARTFHKQPLYSVQAKSACTLLVAELPHHGKRREGLTAAIAARRWSLDLPQELRVLSMTF
jgi:hypothetical protein